MTASNIVNDGGTTTNIVEATLLGSSGSNIVIKNDGTVTVSEYVSSTLTALLKVITGTGVNLGAASRQVEIVGNLQVDGTLIVSAITLSAISAVSAVATGAVTGTKINLTTGSLTRVSVGNSAVGYNTAVAITHNLGAVPDIVCMTPSITGLTSLGYQVYNYTSTQFTVYNTTSSGGVCVYYWVAIKL